MSTEQPPSGQIQTVNLNYKVIRSGSVTLFLPLTGKKTNRRVYLPLPIRLIQEMTEIEGGGCLVRGYYGDECLAAEDIVEIFTLLGAASLGEGVSSWHLAT